MFLSQTFDTYIHAYEHATKWSRCAHVSCGLLIDGNLVCIKSNTIGLHAEMTCLKWLSEKGKWLTGKW